MKLPLSLAMNLYAAQRLTRQLAARLPKRAP
jgi:hypothetical protein